MRSCNGWYVLDIYELSLERLVEYGIRDPSGTRDCKNSQSVSQNNFGEWCRYNANAF